MTAAVVVTTRNEAATVDALLDAVAALEPAPDEVVLVDGGSTDGTAAAARRHVARLPALRVLEAPGSNISRGRNVGIAATRSDVIAVTDAGCVPDRDWLARLLVPFGDDGTVGVVQGVTRPDAQSHLEACIGRCSLAFAAWIGGQPVYPTARTLAFRRTVWAEVGGFPEDLPFGEDAAFVVRAARVARLHVEPRAVVGWRPRRTYGEVVRQFYHYADGLARAGLSGSFHVRTALQSLGGVALLLTGLALRRAWPLVLLAVLAGSYLARKARQGCFAVPTWRTLYRVPLVLLAIHAGTMAGMLHGQWRRWRAGGRPTGPAPAAAP